jgi:tetratricopeptide (TPR) repeat protein
VWDSPRQQEAYDWFTAELANLRTAFRWAADHGDLDVAAPIATYAAWLGFWVENYEPIAWTEELIEPARAVDHRWLPTLYVSASLCWMSGRIEAAVAYSDAGQTLLGSGRDYEVPFGMAGALGGVYWAIGQPDRWVEWCRALLASGRDTHAFTRASLIMALTVESADEATALAEGLIAAAEATGNPCALSYALFAYGLAYRDTDPVRALDALRRGLLIGRDSGNRATETHLASNLARLEAEHGDPLAALDHLTLAIRNYLNSGSTTMVRTALAVLATFLDQLGHHDAAATVAGFAVSFPLATAAFPEITTAIADLRDALGDQTYESLARKGETMTTAAMAAYAYDQIDQARTELERGLEIDDI